VVRRVARSGWALVVAAAVQGCGTTAKTAPPHATTMVSALYGDHFAHEQNWEATYRRQHALFAPELAALLDADIRAAAANADEVVGLDFDPLTDAQEEMTSFQVAPIMHEGDAATVGVLLLQDTMRTNVRLDLARSGARWRVTNIRYAHGDLVSLLRRLAADRRRGP
jgi:hypothetical protein